MKNHIKVIRKRKGLTLRYISYISKVSSSYLSMLETNNKKNPTYKVMKKIAKALDEDIKEVFYE